MVIVLVLVAVVTVVVMRNRGGSDGLDGIDSVDEDDDDLRGRGDKSGKHNFSLDIPHILRVDASYTESCKIITACLISLCNNALVAQWIRRPPPKRKIGGSSPPEGNLPFARSSAARQLGQPMHSQ